MNKFRSSLSFLSLFLVFIFTLSPSFAQEEESKLKEIFLEAESYFLFEEYKDALPLYQRILSADPENFSINYKVGVCYLNDVYQKHKSIQYLEKAVQGTSPDYRQNNFKERNAPLEAWYYLGNAYRINNRLNEALEAYDHFKKVLDPVVYDTELVNEQIKACKVAVDLQSRPNYNITVNMGEKVNQRFEETNPVVSGDESIMAFNRKLQFYDAVFYVELKNGQWSEPVNLTPFFGVDGNSYCTGISYDGKELFVYRLDEFDGNLYVSKREGETWSKLVKLNDNINTKYWESHASVSKDGKTLYFTSNRKGGYGGLDIYKSERTRGGDWGAAINLGPVVNTKYNEETPFLSEDGKTLFFSSLGHYNMGGYDIFYSTRLDNGQWSKPVNMGYPLNTTGDDLFFTPVRNGEYAYYSAYDAADSYGLADIYKMEVFSERHPRKFILNGIARIEDEIKKDYSKIQVLMIDRKSNALVDQASVDPNGTFSLDATSGDFQLVFQGEGIQKTSEDISIPVNNPSNIISYTSPLIAPGLAAAAKTDAAQVQEGKKTLPELISNFDLLEVTNNDPIPIKLELERNSKLSIETYLDGSLKKTEAFDITRKKFIYLFTPEPGNNLLKLTLTDEQGNVNTRDIEIVYTPTAEEMAKTEPVKLKTSPVADFYRNLVSLSSGNLRKFLENMNPDSIGIGSAADLYQYLISQAAANGYTDDDVDQLFIKALAGKDSEVLRDELQFLSSGNLKSSLDTFDIQSKGLLTADALLDLMYNSASESTYSRSDLRRLLAKSVSGDDDLSRFLKILNEFGSDSLIRALGQINAAAQGIKNPENLLDHMIQQYPALEGSLDEALRKSAASLDLAFLHQGLILLSGDSLKQTLHQVNLERQKLNTAEDLIGYLWRKSAAGGYTKEELIDNTDRIRKDPYSVVEMFRAMLSTRATGSLKTVIDEVDIRAMHIDTFEELLDYLIRQSAFHDYNRETVYSLLLDIIRPMNLEDFIASLRHFAGQGILDALDLMNADLYSTPLEVIQYLISISDEHGYSERDILNLLLKVVLEKGTGPDETKGGNGLIQFFSKPGLARNLILVNGIVILLVILFLVLRNKSKKEQP